MRLGSVVLLLTVWLCGCAVVQHNPALRKQPAPDTLASLQQYQLPSQPPAGYDQYQYEALQRYFSQGDSQRQLTIADLEPARRLPGGFFCTRRIAFVLSLGLLPSICHYQQTYSLTLHDRDLALRQRHSLPVQSSRVVWLFASLLAPLPQWSLDLGRNDNRATYTLIDKARQQ